MQQNPAIVGALAQDRIAALRQAAATNVRREQARRRPRVTQAAQQTVGWLLVEMGLRLAVPRSTVTHPNPGGQR